VHISDTGLLAPTRARSATDLGSDGRVIPPSPTSPAGPGLGLDGRGSPTTGTRRSSHQYRFDCELGDVWTELTASTSSGAALALATTHRAPRRTNATITASSANNTVCYIIIVVVIAIAIIIIITTTVVIVIVVVIIINNVNYCKVDREK